MARLFWIAVGAGAGVWAARKVKDKAYKYTPEGVADNVTGIGEAIKYFADEIRAGMSEREQELYRAIGADVTAAALPPALPRKALPGSRVPGDDRHDGPDAYDTREGAYDPRGRAYDPRGRHEEPYRQESHERERYPRERYEGQERYEGRERYDRRDGS